MHIQALVLNFLLWSESRQYNAAILQSYIPTFLHQFTLRWQNPPALVLGFKTQFSMGFRSIRSSL